MTRRPIPRFKFGNILRSEDLRAPRRVYNNQEMPAQVGEKVAVPPVAMRDLTGRLHTISRFASITEWRRSGERERERERERELCPTTMPFLKRSHLRPLRINLNAATISAISLSSISLGPMEPS